MEKKEYRNLYKEALERDENYVRKKEWLKKEKEKYEEEILADPNRKSIFSKLEEYQRRFSK